MPLYDTEMFQLRPGVHMHHIVMHMNAIFYFCCPEKGTPHLKLHIMLLKTAYNETSNHAYLPTWTN